MASFTPSDAFAYWKAVGLNIDPHRVEVINVDGGPGAPGDLSGSFETTLDVEQSGRIATGARVIAAKASSTRSPLPSIAIPQTAFRQVGAYGSGSKISRPSRIPSPANRWTYDRSFISRGRKERLPLDCGRRKNLSFTIRRRHWRRNSLSAFRPFERHPNCSHKDGSAGLS